MKYIEHFLLIYLILYILLVFVWRTWIVWKRTGVSPFVFGKSDSAHDYIGQVYKLMMLLTAGVIIIYGFLPDYVHFLNPIKGLALHALRWTGIGLLIGSLVWIMIAQVHMSASWRIGINENERTQLVTKGLFSISRNPVFLGVLITYSGLFLVLPNMITLVILSVSYFTIQIQVRMEESYLLSVHGADYQSYLLRVRRWI